MFIYLQNQLKALNLGKPGKNKAKQTDAPLSQRSKTEKDSNDGSEAAVASIDDGGELSMQTNVSLPRL